MACWVLVCLLVLAIQTPASSNDQDLYHLGTVHYQRGQWDFAIQRFEELLEKSKDDKLRRLSRFYLAESLVAKKKYTDARAELRRFLENAADHKLAPQARFRLGEVCYLVGDREQALSQLGLFAEQNPSHPLMEYVLPYLGELRIGEGELTLAAELFERSLKTYPNGSLAHEARFGLARALEKTDAVDDAIRFYRYLIDHPESGRAPDSLLQLAKINFHQQKLDEAKSLLDQFAEKYAKHELMIPVSYWKGRIKFEQKDYAAAEKSFLAGLDAGAGPRVIPALKYELARCLSKQERYLDGIAHLQTVVTDYADSDWADDALLLQIQILSNTDQSQEAVSLCREFDKLFPGSELKRHVVACEAESQYTLGNHEVAGSLYSQLLADRRANQAATQQSRHDQSRDTEENWRYKLAVCLIEQNKNGHALQVLQEINFDTATREIQSAARLALATIQIERNQLAAATGNLIAYVDLNPAGEESTRSLMDIVLLFAKRGNLQKADQWLQKLDDTEHRTATALKAADLAFESRQFLFASKWYECAATSNDRGTRCKALMGGVWSTKELGQIESAIEQAGRLVEKFPESEQADKALYLQAVLLAKMSNRLRARRVFEKLVNDYPASQHRSQALLALIPLYRTASPEQLKDLVRPLSQLISSSTGEDTELLMYELAWVLKDIGDSEKAIRCFRQLNEKHPGGRFAGEATLQLASFENKTGAPGNAIRRLEKLLKENPAPKLKAFANFQLGQLHFEQGNYSQAITSWDAVTRNNARPDVQSAAAYWGAEASYRLKDWKSAHRRFAAICSSIDESDEYSAESLLRLGQVCIKLERWNDAIDAIKQLEKITNEPIVLAQGDFVSGRAYSGLGLFSKSRSAFQSVLNNEAAKGTETAAMAQWMIGESWFHQEKLDEAIDAYQRTEILHPFPQWQAAALLQLAKCFRLKNDTENAIDCCRRILKDYSECEYAASARELVVELKSEISSEESKTSNQTGN